MSELTDLITAFRKEVEDLSREIIKDAFNVLYGTVSAIDGDVSVSLTTAYDSTDDYEVRIFSALDSDGVDITDALTITKASVSGFTITSNVPGTVKWQTSRRSPKINLWTE